jgi:hypothetical protein
MELTGQWADALLAAERLHLAKLAIWALLSIVTGTTILALLRLRALGSPLLRHFALQTAAWGVVIGALAWWGRTQLALRDLSGAVALDRFVWLNVGLGVGYVAVGIAIAVLGWTSGRRMGLVGAGIGVVVQGAALTLLDLQLAAQVIR